MFVKRSAVKAPTLPQEVVPVPELGGDVIVRGLGLGDRMNLQQEFKKNGAESHNYGHLAPLLAASVLDGDEKQLFTADQWEAWGSKNYAAAVNLWDIAWRLSDLDGKEAEKLDSPNLRIAASLALRMGRTLEELQSSMSSSEFSMWLALYEEDQWGDARLDFRTGLICSTIGNFAGKSLTKGAASLCPADFMPSLASPKEVMEEPDPVAFFTAVSVSKTFNK